MFQKCICACALAIVPLAANAVTVTEQFGFDDSIFRGGSADWKNGAGFTVEFEDSDIWVDEEPQLQTGSPIFITFVAPMGGFEFVRTRLQINECDSGCGFDENTLEFDDATGIPQGTFFGGQSYDVTFNIPVDGANELLLFWSDPFAEGDELPSISMSFSQSPTVIPLPASVFLLLGALGGFGVLRSRSRRRDGAVNGNWFEPGRGPA